jgi:hypothetical protein
VSIYDFSQDVRGRRQKQSRLLVDDDFSWSDVPRRRGRVGVTDVKTDRYEDRDFDRYDDRYLEQVTARPATRSPRRAIEGRYDDRYLSGRAERYDDQDGDHDPYEFREPEPDPRLAGRYESDFNEDRFAARDMRGEDELHLDEQSGALELAAPGRRTIVITGHGAERNLPTRRPRRESSLRLHERSGFRPDRIALWAFLLGLALVLGATTSSHAAVLHHLAH